MMSFPQILPNYIGGAWRTAGSDARLEIHDPATAEALAEVPLSTAQDVDDACQAAAAALPGWRRVPPIERVQYLFKMKAQLEEHFEELSRIITRECGKTLSEARGEIRRAIDNVECACGIPRMMQGDILEDIAQGIDELTIRQPVGVCGIISPFNFPGMIPFWFLPYAMACGNTVVVKPSERVPLTMYRVMQLIDELDLPAGVVNLVNGGRESVEAMLDHPVIKAISFVGSTEVARIVYSRGSASGKRVQAQGGAKNPIIVLPDAELDKAVAITAESAFGCAGQRCLAASLAVTVGEAREPFVAAMSEAARQRVVGCGLDEDVQMGPVITPQSRQRIEGLIDTATREGARLAVDGRDPKISGYEQGNFIRPTVLDEVAPGSTAARTEIFGPVLGVMHVESVDDAIALVNSGSYGTMACLFTRDGAAARRFRYEAEVGNIGINIGVAAPTAPFPFSGWKDSFFGVLHGQGQHAVDFFTQTKVVVERWMGSTLSVFKPS
jgi:malonate-semialdehyde dehydrogenase (acetylating)/methylmalonate-semialdehyde dehydrogenase